MSSTSGLRLRQLLVDSMRPVDAASVTFFRVSFAALMVAWAWNYLASGRVTDLYVTPQFHFTYAGFQWLKPWPGEGMYWHFIGLLGLALMILCGCFYRTAALLFAIGFSYVFLLERTNYQNHYYLVLLISWMLPWLPLNRMLSVDATRKPSLRSSTVPAGVLTLLRFQIAIPYIYGGIAKWTPDWILGQPLEMYLSTKADLPIVGGWLATPGVGLLMSWSGMLFDLAIVPALLVRRTRPYAFVLCIAFHVTNSILFSIHVFPWLMIAASTLFFAPAWPRRLLSAAQLDIANHSSWRGSRRQWIAVVAILVFAVFQISWPLRSRLNQEPTSWSERGHLFSWRMMLRAKEVGIGFAVYDPATQAVANVDHKQFLSREQSEKFARDPQLVLQMAHFIADKFEQDMGRRPQVHAFVLASLNGRKPQLMLDPNQDLASVSASTLMSSGCLLSLSEPLRSPAWDVPISHWREHIELPEMEFLQPRSREVQSVDLTGTYSSPFNQES